MRRMAAVLGAALCLLPGSCSLEDSRDECCGGAVMEYEYMYRNEDVFPQYIHALDHYLFAADGRFIAMLPPGEDLRRQPLDLDSGSYTMVTVGNASERIALEGHAEKGLDGFLLTVLRQERNRAVREFTCGELYGGFCRFTVTGAPAQRFITQMSNIHCQLDVRVEWETRPPSTGDYRIALWNVPCRYNMDIGDIHTAGGHDFPADTETDRDGYGTVVPLKSQTLTTAFVTLRYTSGCIPSLRVFLGGEAITPALDLGRAFRQWGWNPDRDTVQHYRIRVTVRGDGSVSVRPWVEGEVMDWVDGGVFS